MSKLWVSELLLLLCQGAGVHWPLLEALGEGQVSYSERMCKAVGPTAVCRELVVDVGPGTGLLSQGCILLGGNFWSLGFSLA